MKITKERVRQIIKKMLNDDRVRLPELYCPHCNKPFLLVRRLTAVSPDDVREESP